MKFLLQIVFGAVLSIILLGSPADAAWRKIDESKNRLLFQPPYMGNWNPGISVKEIIGGGGQADWMCWRNFQSPDANACVTYQTTRRKFNGKGRSVSDILRYYGAFEKISYSKVGDIWDLQSELGGVKLLRFHVVLNSMAKKNCVAFSFESPRKKRSLQGWHCNAKELALDANVIEKIIKTVGIKGKYEPMEVVYSPIAPVSSISKTEITDFKLCKAAVDITSGRPPIWEPSMAYRAEVIEAKQRNLTPESCATLVGKGASN